jgi:hypothetical protein
VALQRGYRFLSDDFAAHPSTASTKNRASIASRTAGKLSSGRLMIPYTRPSSSARRTAVRRLFAPSLP